MSPHQSKTGVYVFFFCIRAKLIHVFVSELLLLSSLSLLLLLSFAGTFLFSLVTTTILCVDHCVSGESVSPEIGGLCPPRETNPKKCTRNRTQYWERRRRKMHISHGVALSSSVTRMRLECAWDDVAHGVAQPEVLSLFGTSVAMSRGQRGIALSCGQSFQC